MKVERKIRQLVRGERRVEQEKVRSSSRGRQEETKDGKLTDELSSNEIDPDDETVVHDLHVGEELGCENK